MHTYNLQILADLHNEHRGVDPLEDARPSLFSACFRVASHPTEEAGPITYRTATEGTGSLIP